MNEYMVSLVINLAADSPEEAAKEMIQWLKEDGPEAWVYVVEDLGTGATLTYDAGEVS